MHCSKKLFIHCDLFWNESVMYVSIQCLLYIYVYLFLVVQEVFGFINKVVLRIHLKLNFNEYFCKMSIQRYTKIN